MNLAKHYDTLTNDERLRLYIAAAARRDVEEIDTLDATCPQKSYRMMDYGFMRPRVRIAIMTLAYHGEMRSYAAQAYMLLTILLAKPEEDAEDKASEAVDIALGKFLDMYNAWRISCEKNSYDPEELAKAHGVPTDYQTEFTLSLIKEYGIEENAQAQQEYLEALEEMWK